MNSCRRVGEMFLFPVIFLSSSIAAIGGDDVALSAGRGAGPNEIVLGWSGGGAPYQVFRSSVPTAVVSLSHLVRTTANSSLVDAVPVAPGTLVFYQVTGGSFELTNVPPCPTPTGQDLVHGQVELGAGNCTDFEVAAYIRVPAGSPGAGAWWTKPTHATAITHVLPDCSFSFDSDTGGIDYDATDIATFLVPIACNDSCQTTSCPPCAGGQCELPTIPEAVAFKRVARTCPGQPVLSFVGRQWAAKQSATPVGPGPNVFCGGPQDVWVDANGLHLTISDRDGDGQWCSTEVILAESLGYGEYCFQTRELDLPDPWMVAGFFTWDSCAPAPYREIDFEFARWGNSSETCHAQYAVQPCSSCTGCGDGCAAHCQRFAVPASNGDLTHFLEWSPGSAAFRTYQGRHCGGTPPAGDLLRQWTYAGSDVPSPGVENFRFNFWLLQGHAPLLGHEITITDFKFTEMPAKRR